MEFIKRISEQNLKTTTYLYRYHMSLIDKLLAKFQKTQKGKLEIYARVYRASEGKWYDLGCIAKGNGINAKAETK